MLGKKFALAVAVASAGLLGATGWAATVVVNSIAPSDATPGVWGVSDPRTGTTGSTASIVDLTGQGGNLENNQPLPTGAARITTDGTNASMAEIGVTNNYGTAGTVLRSLNLQYSYFKAPTAGNAASAPSIKLSFFNPTYAATPGNDGFVTLIYEPYWQPANGGAVATNQWLTDAISFDQGLFWANGGFGQPNGGGGPPLNTLDGWLSAFNGSSGGAFSDATMTEVRIGMGSFQPSQDGYFDKVVINGTSVPDTTYNFEAPRATPLPSAAGMGFMLVIGMGVVTLVRKRRATV